MSDPRSHPGDEEPRWDPSRPPQGDQPPPGSGWPPPGGPPSGGPPPPGAPPQGWPGGDQGQYGYGGPPPPRRQTEGLAIVALVLAIASFVICPVLPAVAALIVAGNASAKIRSSGGWLEGEGLVTAARVVAWVHIGLVVLGVLAVVVAVLATSGDQSALAA